MKSIVFLAFLSLVFVSCKKKETQGQVKVESKWEALTGLYHVYDTTGIFLYEMELSRLNETDTLVIENFDGEFDLLEKQNYSPTYPYALTIWSHNAIVDTIGNRWNVMGYGTDQIYNNLRNDTIRMLFLKHNTPYWWNDGTSYSYEECKQIAVKQH